MDKFTVTYGFVLTTDTNNPVAWSLIRAELEADYRVMLAEYGWKIVPVGLDSLP